MKVQFISFFIMATVLFSCKEDDEEVTPQDPADQFLVGKTTGDNVFYAPLPDDKISLIPAENEMDTLNIDFNFDGVNDIKFQVARQIQEDTIFTSYVAVSALNGSEIAIVDSTDFIQRFNYSAVLVYEDLNWETPDLKFMASQYISPSDTIETGNFNNLENQYFSVTCYDEFNQQYLGWIKVTVRDYQRLYIYGYATKLMP